MESMTGIGTGSVSTEQLTISAEARSVNHKSLSLSVSLPDQLSPFEDRVNAYLRNLFTRGRIKVAVRLDRTDGAKGEMVIDQAVLDTYIDCALQLFKVPGVNDELSAGDLLTLPGVAVVSPPPDLDESDLEDLFEECIRSCFKDLKKSRRREGKALLPLFTEALEALRAETDPVLDELKASVRQRFEKLRERVKRLLEGAEPDEGRMLQELALLADRSDVTEEVHRLNCHIDHALETVEGEDPDLGRTLGFIIQEMNREINTLGSKSDDPGLSRRVVRMKNLLSSMKEQVANVQ